MWLPIKRHFPLAIAWLLLFLVLLTPWLIQLAATPDDHVPTGHLVGYEDYVTFIAKMEWGKAGHWTYANRYTPEPTESVPIYGFYLFLGHLSDWTGLPTVWAFHLARSVLGATALICWWLFCRRYSTHPVVACILGLFASFGFFKLFGEELWIYEHFVQGHAAYMGLLGFPHYLVDFLAVLAILHAYLSGRNVVLLAALAGAGLGLVHPFLLALFPVIPVVHAICFDRAKLRLALTILVWAGIASAPLVIPQLVAYTQTPWLQEWRAQTGHDAVWWEDLIRLCFTYGIAGVLAWGFLVRALRRGSELEKVCAAWLMTAAALLFLAPLPNSREFAFFISLPVGLLAAPHIVRFAKRIAPVRWKPAVVAATILCCAHGLSMLGTVMVPHPDAYHPKAVIEGLKWLEAESEPDDAALCSWAAGSFIPMYVLHPRPWVGHPTETLDFKEKADAVEPMFAGKEPPRTRWAVIVKRLDRELPRPDTAPVYENKEILIWETGGWKQ